MLQIISGKFFKKAERHVYDARGVLYSNFDGYGDIETVVGKLQPVDFGQQISTYVFTYKNQIEKGGALIRTGDREIVDQFRLLCMLGLNAYFDESRPQVEHVCRPGAKSQQDSHVPSALIPGMLDLQATRSADQVDQFVELVAKSIAMPRDHFKAVMRALASLRHAVLAVEDSVDLAYSMIVYCIESLAQQFDDFVPSWEDYDQDRRGNLDAVLDRISKHDADSIRGILVDSSQLRLMKRFTAFVEEHLADSFYTTESAGRTNALRKSWTARACTSAYSLRSSFVHELAPIQEHLRLPHTKGDVFVWDGEPHLTLSGLLRVATHVIRTFIARAPELTTEEVDWKQQLPGLLTVELAPSAWISIPSAFPQRRPYKTLNAFLKQVSQWFVDESPVTDIGCLMPVIDADLPGAPADRKFEWLALFWLFEGLREPNSDPLRNFLQKHQQLARECRIETVTCHLLLGEQLPWSLPQCRVAYDDYYSKRFHKNAIRLPPLVEVALASTLANLAIEQGLLPMHSELLTRAIYEAPGWPSVQVELESARHNSRAADIDALIRGGAESDQ